MEFTHKPSELQEREQAQIKVEVESEDEPEQTTNQIYNYNLVRDRKRRTIRALDRYGHVDMVYYALLLLMILFVLNQIHTRRC